MRKPTTNFRNLDPAQLIQYGEEIAKKMKEQAAVFSGATALLTALRSKLIKFRHAVAEAAFNDRQAMARRNEERAELEHIIRELCKYVDTVARGSETIVLSAGFVPSKIRDYGKLANPKGENLRVEPAGLGTGSVLAKLSPWKKARYYQFEYRKKGSEADWEEIRSTRSVLAINDLDAFQEYEFRATYLIKDTNPNYSDIVSTYAL